jgi:hypothetical protein
MRFNRGPFFWGGTHRHIGHIVFLSFSRNLKNYVPYVAMCSKNYLAFISILNQKMGFKIFFRTSILLNIE